MNIQICNRLEAVHYSNVLKIEENEVTLKKSQSFIECRLEFAASYKGVKQGANAGVVLNETITSRLRYNKGSYFLQHPLEFFILRVHTNEGFFIVGSIEYPAVMSASYDKRYINLTFKASSPA